MVNFFSKPACLSRMFLSGIPPRRLGTLGALKVFSKSSLLPGHQLRNFHATQRCQIEFLPALDACCFQTYHLIKFLHMSTGLSWFLTLPLTALLIRMTCVFPFNLWSRKHRNRAATVRPLLYAWRPILQQRIYKEYSQLGPAACQKLLLQKIRAKQKELHATFSVKRWPTFTPLLQLPVWLLAVETIRKMCGTREGLLGLVAKNLGHSDGPSEQAEGVAKAFGVPIESSFEFGGALWFTDLLTPDPILVLPFILSATLFTNISLAQRQQLVEGIEPSKGMVRWTRAFKIIALAAGPATLHVPSAILIYWISSSSFAIAQNLIIDNLFPRPVTASSCKPITKSYLAGKIGNT